jgi:imidazolonepropionase-like amidohydrolase
MKITKLFFALAAIAAFSFAPLAQSRLETVAITNARIVTVSGATVEKGTIVVRDGLIESVGADAKVPGDARVMDGTGLTVYPGFIDALTNLGTQQAQARPQGPPQIVAAPTPPASSANYPVAMQPEKYVFDELRPGEAQFESPRSAGFTTAVTVGREGVFNGQSVVINLAGDSVSAMIVRAPFAQHFTFRTVPGAYPGSLIGTFAAFRQMMLDARRQQELEKSYAANPRGMRRPDGDRSLEALYPVVNGTMPVVFNANSENEIVRALDLAKELGLRAIIAGGQEAWKVADRLRSMNVPVLLSLNFPKRTAVASPDADPESLEVLRMRAATPKGPGILAQKGVRFAFQSGGMTSLGDFFANAAKAAENGLSKEAAVRAMTLSSAEILGIEDRLGSLEPGKIANLTVTRGDVLSKDRAVTHVFIDGRLFEQKPRPQTPSPAGGGTAPTAAQVGGSWKITIEVPGQTLEGTLTFIQQGATITGTLTTEATGSSPVKDGKVSGESVSFSATVSMGGTSFDISVTGKVAGNQISGTIDSPQGAVPFSGSRVP